MIILDRSKKTFFESLKQTTLRANLQLSIESKVENILNDVKNKGDEALILYAQKFDNVHFQSPSEMRVTLPKLTQIKKTLSAQTRQSIDIAYQNVFTFANLRKPQNWLKTFPNGATLGEQFSPLDRVGVYIPGGTAPLISTIIHTAAIAQAAGVKEIVAVTPPLADLTFSLEMAYACHLCGIKEVYQIGGVYAIGALAYGTQTIPKVQKIVGPGNAYVTVAKKKVYGDVAIDMIAGPSEILVLADDTANPKHVAADLLSQLEHGGGNLAFLVTPSEKLLKAVKKELPLLAKRLNRITQLTDGLENGTILIQTNTLNDAIEVANFIAPEHLEIMCKNAINIAPKLTASGAIFIGNYTPEPVGDYVAGASHVLPTNGSAKFFSGLSVESFFRRSSIAYYSKEQLKNELSAITHLANCEGLTAHALSASIRFESEGKK